MERDIRFGTWNLRNLCRSGSLTAVARELARHKLVLVGVQAVRWDKGGTTRTGDYIIFHGKGNDNHHFPTYHVKILLGDFNAKLGRENIFKPTVGNEYLHQDSNDNCVIIVNFAS